jgi:hypothetical protein
MFFSTFPRAADGFQLKTWRGGPQAGQPKLSPVSEAMRAPSRSSRYSSSQCAITWIYYMGDEGEIVCKLDHGANAGKEAFTSITHLRFDPRLPLAREIAAYQKPRVKRLSPRNRRRVGLQPGAGLANGHPSSSLNGIECFACSGEVSRRYAASLAVEAFVEQNLPP